jgi:hypothetical protein
MCSAVMSPAEGAPEPFPDPFPHAAEVARYPCLNGERAFDEGGFPIEVVIAERSGGGCGFGLEDAKGFRGVSRGSSLVALSLAAKASTPDSVRKKHVTPPLPSRA